ncbi:MAG: YihY/virulence factor BrkB family protein [Minisyncoccales bacterium]
MIIHTKNILKNLIKKIREDEVPMLAAALSYFSVFTVAPILVILISIASGILENNLVREEVFQYFKNNISSETALIFEKVVDQIMKEDLNTVLSIISFLVLFYIGVQAFNHLQIMFNKILVPNKEKSEIKKFFSKYFHSALFLFIFIIFILFTVSASIFFPTLQYFFSDYFFGGDFGQVISFISSFIISVLFFILMYRVLTRKEISYKAIITGAFFAGALLNIMNVIVSNYLSHPTLSVYGIIGSIFIFLTWVYFFSCIILLGAEIMGVVDKKD